MCEQALDPKQTSQDVSQDGTTFRAEWVGQPDPERGRGEGEEPFGGAAHPQMRPRRGPVRNHHATGSELEGRDDAGVRGLERRGAFSQQARSRGFADEILLQEIRQHGRESGLPLEHDCRHGDSTTFEARRRSNSR
jgi:hypothetical protein